MPRAQRLVLVVVCAAVLVLVGSWKTALIAIGEVQSRVSQPAPSSIDPLVLKALQWRSIGPARGGRSIAVSGVKGRPKEAYFGAVGGGLWKTTDGGENWAPVTDGQINELVGRRGRGLRVEPRHRLHRHGRVVHPRQHHAGRRRLQVDRRRQDLDARRLPRTRRASRGSASIRRIPTSSSSRRSASTACRSDERGVFKSTDGGKTWKQGAVPRRARPAPSISRSIARIRT